MVRIRLFLIVTLGCISVLAADRPTPETPKEKDSLAVWNGLVGAWKGVGQPQRGSSKGSWSETIACHWHFHEGHAELVLDNAQGKYFASAILRSGPKADQFALQTTMADGQTTVEFQGTRQADGKLVLECSQPADNQPARITLQLVANGDRLSLLAEKALGEGRYSRLAEIGYTRDGSNFGKGGDGPECIVTGGKGTIAVEYKGQTYYVCCSGCKDAFKENPEQIMAEYQARLAKKQKP